MYVHFCLPVYPSSFLSGHQWDKGPCLCASVQTFPRSLTDPRLAIVKPPRSTSQQRWPPDVICARSTEVLGLTSKLLVWRNVEDGEWGRGLRSFEDFSLRIPGSWWNWVLMKNFFGICLFRAPTLISRQRWDERWFGLYFIADYSNIRAQLQNACRTWPRQRLHGSRVHKKWSWQLPATLHGSMLGWAIPFVPGIMSLDRSGGNDTSHLVETKSSASKWPELLRKTCDNVW